jgi:leader peptidase (prepilin peptidase)/N-methyltransferase
MFCLATPCYNTPMLAFLPIAVFGWMCGATVNYLADILPVKRAITRPFCLECETSQSMSNYFIWPRRCSHCGEARAWRVWIVEILFIAAAITIWISPPARLNFLIAMFLLIYFGVVCVIDIEHRLILHPVSLAGGVIGLIIGVWLHGFWYTILGGIAGFGIMLLLYILGAGFVRVLARHRGETASEEALGFGDVNLSGVLGFLLGWPGILAGLILTILLAGLVSFVYLLLMLFKGRYRSSLAIPYGPFLVSSAVILLYFPHFIQVWIGR